MGDEEIKVKVTGHGANDLAIELSNGVDLIKALRISSARLNFAPGHNRLVIECDLMDDELEVVLENTELDVSKIEVIHRYPQSENELEVEAEKEPEKETLTFKQRNQKRRIESKFRQMLEDNNRHILDEIADTFKRLYGG
jgi:hypothetical protein